MSKRLKTVRQWIAGGWDFEGLKMLEKELRRMEKPLGKRIVEIAKNEFEMYKLAEKELGLRGACLACLLMHIDFSKGINKIKRYVRSRGGRRARAALANYAMIIYLNAKRGACSEKYMEIAAKAPSKKEAIKKIQDKILKDLRRLWRKHFSDQA